MRLENSFKVQKYQKYDKCKILCQNICFVSHIYYNCQCPYVGIFMSFSRAYLHSNCQNYNIHTVFYGFIQYSFKSFFPRRSYIKNLAEICPRAAPIERQHFSTIPSIAIQKLTSKRFTKFQVVKVYVF